MSTENTKPINDPSKILLKLVRISYPHIYTPKLQKGATKPKYSADFLLDKKLHAPVIAQIEKIIERVSLDFFKKKVTIKADKMCLHDGNERPDKDGYGDEVMFLVGKNDRPFPIVDQNKMPLTEQSGKPYGGSYVNVLVRFYAWKHETGGAGISCSIETIQFAKDGPSFGAGPVDPYEVFEEVSSSADDPSNY